MNTSKPNSKLTKRQQIVLSGRFNQTETARKSIYRPGQWVTAAGYTSAALLYRLADSGLIGFGVESGSSAHCYYAAPTAEGERIRELTQGVALSRRQQELLVAMYKSEQSLKNQCIKYASGLPGNDAGLWFAWSDLSNFGASTVYALASFGLLSFVNDSLAQLTPDGEELATLLSQVR